MQSSRVTLLDHGIRPDPKKAKLIQKFRPPYNNTGVKSCMVVINYFKIFILVLNSVFLKSERENRNKRIWPPNLKVRSKGVESLVYDVSSLSKISKTGILLISNTVWFRFLIELIMRFWKNNTLVPSTNWNSRILSLPDWAQ